MKATKVFLGNKRLKDIYVGATKWEVFKYRVVIFLREVLIRVGIVVALFAMLITGMCMSPTAVAGEVEKTIEVPSTKTIAPVLVRIGKCESSTGHYGPNGQVIVIGNKNGSVDIGKYQINEKLWGKKATELKFNLFLEADNEAMAVWLYKNYGTEPWVWSKPCWQK